MRRRGFTIVEMVASMVVIATLASVGASVIFTAADGYAATAAAARLHADMDAALQRIVRELRRIPDDADTQGAQPDITSVTPVSIAWGGGWALEFSADRLLLTEPGGQARTLLDGVTGFALAAMDGENASLAQFLTGTECHAVRRVSLTITAAREGRTLTLRTRVAIRAAMAGVAQ